MKKLQILTFVTAIFLVACGGNAQKKAADASTATSDMHTAETSLDYVGTYAGTTPAADCPGIDVTLTLKSDGTYTEHNKYQERDAEYDAQGGYAVSGNILTLTDKEGEMSYYKVEENRLRRLDRDKQVITGALADNYTLSKTEN
ncbi:MAG: copper resistance protein NlpE [Alistipes sp.]